MRLQILIINTRKNHALSHNYGKKRGFGNIGVYGLKVDSKLELLLFVEKSTADKLN